MPNLQYVSHSLEYLDLNNNLINSIPHDYFKTFSRLKDIGLESTGLTEMPDFSYLNATLNTINLSNNNMTWCNSLCEVKYEQLTEVDMKDNQLRYISFPEVLENWPAVSMINLVNNSIENVPDLRNVTTRRKSVLIELTGTVRSFWTFSSRHETRQLGGHTVN